jgi:hypothetical protein
MGGLIDSAGAVLSPCMQVESAAKPGMHVGLHDSHFHVLSHVTTHDKSKITRDIRALMHSFRVMVPWYPEAHAGYRGTEEDSRHSSHGQFTCTVLCPPYLKQ